MLLTPTQSLSPHSGHPTLGAPLTQKLLFAVEVADNQEGPPTHLPLTLPSSQVGRESRSAALILEGLVFHKNIFNVSVSVRVAFRCQHGPS